MPKVSVVIATYNRQDLLKNSIDAVINQTANKEDYEIIVVNNNSKDNTQEVLDKYIREYPGLIFSVFEKNQGLSYARNAGYNFSKSDFVAYIDDDGKATPEWIEKIIEIIDQYNPDIFGGPIYPYYTTEKPDWFKDKYDTHLHAAQTGWMKEGWISESNFILKKSFLEEIGGFNTEIGMKGDVLSYGEGTALIAQAYKNNKKIYYDLSLSVGHHVPHYKLNPFYWIVSLYKQGVDRYKIWPEGDKLVWKQMSTVSLLSEEIEFLWNNVKFNSDAPDFYNFIVEEFAPRFSEIGASASKDLDSNYYTILPGVVLSIRKRFLSKFLIYIRDALMRRLWR